VEDALRAAAQSDDRAYGILLDHGTMQLGFYRPLRVDPQSPHTQDEIYVVQKGTGNFMIDDETRAFAAGDALFVPAGSEHRFSDFSDDFCAWVVFYGPDGGERPA
jgi:mannose-6-phosphate isomerase-like protein (cupin superfamily)